MGGQSHYMVRGIRESPLLLRGRESYGSISTVPFVGVIHESPLPCAVSISDILFAFHAGAMVVSCGRAADINTTAVYLVHLLDF